MRNRLQEAPALISLDWHQDLAHPSALECEWLRGLDNKGSKEVALFCWDKLHCNNDGHILAAAYLNIIGDIHVVQKQDRETNDHFVDVNGDRHEVRCYNSIEELLDVVSDRDYPSAFFDIDLDYFTESLDSCGGGDEVELVSEQEIFDHLFPGNGLMS